MVSIFSFYMYNLSVFQKNIKCYSFMPVTVLHYTPTELAAKFYNIHSFFIRTSQKWLRLDVLNFLPIWASNVLKLFLTFSEFLMLESFNHSQIYHYIILNLSLYHLVYRYLPKVEKLRPQHSTIAVPSALFHMYNHVWAWDMFLRCS